jgi:MBG domain (YGX type)
VASVTLTSAGAVATAGVAGSPYAIMASAATGTGLGNYNISYHDGHLTVHAIALDITATDQSKNYGEAFTFTGTEFSTGAGELKNSDSVASVTLTSTGAAATAGVAGSPYLIMASAATGTGLGNYNISYHDGHLTVNAIALDITANNQSKNYGITFTFTGTEFHDRCGPIEER